MVPAVFFVLGSYFILEPVREYVGRVAVGLDRLDAKG